MKRGLRVILGFYSSEHVDAEEAFHKIGAAFAGRAQLFHGNGAKPHAGAEAHYSALRLEGESLVVAEAPPDNVQAIVEQLQSTGLPGVFVLQDSLASPSAAREATGERKSQQQSKRSMLARLRASELALDAARRDLIEAARLGQSMTAAAEWMLDNAYLIRTQIAETRRHLPRDYPRLLPNFPPHAACPNVYDLARQLVAGNDHVLNENNIAECLRHYQITSPLTIAELWLFPLLLRMALFESLVRLGVRVSRAQQLREAANLWANRLAASMRRGTNDFEEMLKRLEAEPFVLQPHFVTSLAERLQDEENTLGPVKRWMEDRGKMPLTDLLRSEHADEAAQGISTANAFGSLRALSRIDFTEIFEAVSLVDGELRNDPSGVYAQSDFATRDQCRRAVERIALESGISELDVARRVTVLAARPGPARITHAPYYLLAGGVAELEHSTGARIPLRIRLIRALRRYATPAYLAAVAGLSGSFLALAVALAWEGGVHQTTMLAMLCTMALFPLSELSIQIVNALVISLLPPDLLPKLDFRKGIPQEHATLVVVPMMLSSLEVVQREVEKLEVRYLANREENLFFSLFPDFTDSLEPTEPPDAALLEAARDGINRLNARYSGGRFLLFHRPRVWSESERRWIGRERKRGKLEDLNTFLVGPGNRRDAGARAACRFRSAT